MASLPAPPDGYHHKWKRCHDVAYIHVPYSIKAEEVQHEISAIEKNLQ